MKQLLNDDLTNHRVFEIYEDVVEPILCDLFPVYIEIWDAEKDLTEDYGNEYLILFKVGLTRDTDVTLDDEVSYLTFLTMEEELEKLVRKMNEQIPDNSGDYFYQFQPIIVMNACLVIPFTMQK